MNHGPRTMNSRKPAVFFTTLCLLAIQPGFAQDGAAKQALAGKSTVLLVRHAEKPAQGTGLTPEGERRAEAYVDFFTHYRLAGQPLRVDALFAARDSENSMRSRLTFTPLSHALKLPLDTAYEGKNFAALATRLRGGEYRGKTVLVCWKHGEILALAEAVGASPARLPASARWPAKWPDGEFRWVLQIVRDESGAMDPARTLCIANPPLKLGGTAKAGR